MPISETEKEQVYNVIYNKIITTNFDPIKSDIQSFAQKYLENKNEKEQHDILVDFISYIRNRVPVATTVIKMVIPAARLSNQVPEYLLDCGTAIWGSFITPSTTESASALLKVLTNLQPSIDASSKNKLRP